MAVESNEIYIAGQAFPLSGDIRVVNFAGNPDYDFRNPIACGAGAAPTGPAIPGLTTTPPPAATEGSGGSSRTGTRNRGLRDLAMGFDAARSALSRTIKQVVIHHDATFHSAACFGVLCARNLSTHFMINWDGSLIQGADVFWSTYHARGRNNFSIGIDMNNVAVPEGHSIQRSDPLFGGVVDYAIREVVEGRINRSLKESFVYTEAQYTTLCAVLRTLHEVLEIPLIYPQDDSGGVLRRLMREPDTFRGFFGHWHCQAGKWDPGPGFSWETVMECLHGKSNHWPIQMAGLEPLREIRTQEQVVSNLQPLFDNTESGPSGGTYPVGMNQDWHDGVHFHAPHGTPVYACAEGKIILTRNGPNLPLGSPNFVLVQHDMERERLVLGDTGEYEVLKENIRWYSLYMHLERHDPAQVPIDVPEGEENEEAVAPVDPDAPPVRPLPAWYVRLVQIARASRGGSGLRPRSDFTLAEMRQNPELFLRTIGGFNRVLDVESENKHLSIEDGNPWRWLRNVNMAEPETETGGFEIGGGELLGYVGEYGELVGERVQTYDMFQFQIFSMSPIFDDTRFDRTEWRRVQADLTGDSLVAARDLVLPIMGGEQTAIDQGINQFGLGRGRVLTPSQIQRFYRSGRADWRHEFRTTIASHLSEWDIGNDDSLTANVPVAWPWMTDQEYLEWQALHAGYKWLTDDVRDLFGMIPGDDPANHTIFTYHPFYLLGWWALNYGRSVQGQTFEGASDEQIEEAIANYVPDEEDGGSDAFRINLDELDNFRIHYDDLDMQENGEWAPDVEFVNPFQRRR
jgi:N-acetyl-anhydromuramyl-L-alanine amidase AmpD